MDTTVTVPPDQLRAGDLLQDAGSWHRITGVRRPTGGAWPIAIDGTGWAIALADRPLTVRRCRVAA